MKIVDVTQNLCLGEVRKAHTLPKRLVGLLLTDPAKDARALWIKPSNSIHMIGMRYPLHIVFLSRSLEVLQVNFDVKPFCPGLICWKAHSVLEFFKTQKEVLRVRVGDHLRMDVS